MMHLFMHNDQSTLVRMLSGSIIEETRSIFTHTESHKTIFDGFERTRQDLRFLATERILRETKVVFEITIVLGILMNLKNIGIVLVQMDHWALTTVDVDTLSIIDTTSMTMASLITKGNGELFGFLTRFHATVATVAGVRGL